ncbi:FAD-dependent oxidoreductase [Archangium violaceum]|uniref:flavin monoamine oxidase family protein n=1 Tax=Archangium violaceum TaxID=83451 RepID=UPI002B2F55C0|nr:FAD-dependent oxidoreductase [Archangium gephyra]
MPVFPNLRSSKPGHGRFAAAPPMTPVAFVDAPTMNYVTWLNNSTSGIATFDNASAYHVAVIGSGAAGLATAYELLRCGLNVTVFEATDRIGGRLFTSPSSTQDGNVFEMGAMRFTPSEQVLHWYGNLFNQTQPGSVLFDTGSFPNPGENLTYIAFQGQTYIWDPNDVGGHPLPAEFNTVSNGWTVFMDKGFASADGTINLVAPATMTTWLADPRSNTDAIIAAWSSYIGAFVNNSLYEAVVRIFTDKNAPGGTPWQQCDLEFFGALGTGFGGFGPLFPICFLDIMRFVINAVDTDQHELLTGVSSLVTGFLNQPITRPDGTRTTVSQNVVTNKPVTAVASKGTSVTLTFADNSTQVFDRVVVATSHRSMELTMGLGTSMDGLPLAEPVADALRRVHLENSSKVFVETSAFWNQQDPATSLNWPRNVVGDTLLRNLYTLTYPKAPSDTGVLLFSYTWADDSVKQQAFTDVNARIALLMRDLESISPGLATAVGNSMRQGTAQLIDWQRTPFFFGAFKLNQPGQDNDVASLWFDFLKASKEDLDTGVYVAGDSIGFLGGWVENAFHTGLNAAAGVVVSLGGTLTDYANSPFAQLNPSMYNYSVPAGSTVPEQRKVGVPSIVSNSSAKVL